MKTTFEDEYYVTFRAEPRWPDANFYCPTPETCQDFYELEMTIDVNNIACAPNPSVNRTAYPLVAPYPNEDFKLGQSSKYVRYDGVVSNGECGFAFGDPYVFDSNDANQVAIFNQFEIAKVDQVSFKVSDGSLDRKINYIEDEYVIKYQPVSYVDANTKDGIITLAVDIDFFNSG